MNFVSSLGLSLPGAAILPGIVVFFSNRARFRPGVYHRFPSHDLPRSLPDRLLPTLSSSSPRRWWASSPVWNSRAFARLLYYHALFLTLLLFISLSWWAYAFPMAAITIATLRMFPAHHVSLFRIIGAVLLVALTANAKAVLYLARGDTRGELRGIEVRIFGPTGACRSR